MGMRLVVVSAKPLLIGTISMILITPNPTPGAILDLQFPHTGS